MKTFVSILLLIFAFALFAAGGFEITGMMGAANLLGAIAFSLAAQALAFVAGIIAKPRNGKVGVVRSIVFVFFLLQSISFFVNLFALIYQRVRHVEILAPHFWIGGWRLAPALWC